MTLRKGFQRDCVPLAEFRGRASDRVRGSAPENTKRFAKGESKNSPVDCFLRGNALQVKAFPYKKRFFIISIILRISYAKGSIYK